MVINMYIYRNVGGVVDRECIGEGHKDCMAVSGNVWGCQGMYGVG